MGRFMLSVARRHKRDVNVLGEGGAFEVEFSDQRGKTACIVSLAQTKTMLRVVVCPGNALHECTHDIPPRGMHKRAMLRVQDGAAARAVAIEDVLMPQGANGAMEFTMRGDGAHDDLHALLMLLVERSPF